MSKTPEIKVAESIVNLTESHWFNPTIFGRYLADQPAYTSDRIMEMVVSIISEQAKQHGLNNQTSEGILLAVELNACVKAYQEYTKLNNLTLPKPAFQVKKKVQLPVRSHTFGWAEEDKDPFN